MGNWFPTFRANTCTGCAENTTGINNDPMVRAEFPPPEFFCQRAAVGSFLCLNSQYLLNNMLLCQPESFSEVILRANFAKLILHGHIADLQRHPAKHIFNSAGQAADLIMVFGHNNAASFSRPGSDEFLVQRFNRDRVAKAEETSEMGRSPSFSAFTLAIAPVTLPFFCTP